MKKSGIKSVLISILAMVLAAMSLLFVACGETEEPPPVTDTPKAPVSVAEAGTVTIAVGSDKRIVVADYITANGNPVTAESDSVDIATVKLESGILTVSAVAEGETKVKLSCTGADVTVEKIFEVSCVVRYTVTVDGASDEYDGGAEFTFPAAAVSDDADMEFDCWSVDGKTERYAPNDKITVNENLTVVAVYKRKAAESVKTTGTLVVAEGAAGEINVAEYIVDHGNEVTVKSSDPSKAAASLEGGVIKVTGVAEGAAKVTVSCGETFAEITVTVTEYTGVKYTVTVNGTAVGEYKPSAEFTFPAAVAPEDTDMEFDYWSVSGRTERYAPNDKIAVTENLVVTAVNKRKAPESVKAAGTLELTLGQSGSIDVAEYIVTHGNVVSVSASDPSKATANIADDGTVAVETLAVGETNIIIECGDVSATVALTVSPRDEDAPTFGNVTLEIDLFEKENVAHSISPSFVPEGKTFDYSYAVAEGVPAAFEGDLLTYTPSGDKAQDIFTVTVTATPDEGDVKTVTFQVTVHIADTRPSVKDSELIRVGALDMFGCDEKLDLAANIENAENVSSFTVSVDGGEAAASKNEFALSSLKSVANGLTEKEITLTVKALYGDNKFAAYTYKLTVVDTSAYRVVNGGFETGTLEGWTPDWEEGKPIANVTNADKYFDNAEYGKDGEWLLSGACDFAANPDNGRETNMGTLESSPFTLRPNAVVTFKLGGAKNPSTGIKFVTADGTVLAQFYNTDIAAKEGTLVLYKYAFGNEEAIENCKVVIYDYATGDWGLVVIDSIETYVLTAPASAVEARNVYADKSALKAAIDNAPSEQGDYTAETYNALKAKIESAKADLNGDYILSTRVAELVGEIGDAVAALEVRTPVAKADTVKSFKLAPEGTKEIAIADYIDDKGLSSLTYAVVSSDTAAAIVSEIADGKFTVTAIANGTARITLDVFYNGGTSAVLTVELTFTVTDAADPTLKEESVIARSKHIDLYDAVNKDETEIDFSQFLDNPASVELSFTATQKIGDGEAESITLSDGKYTLAFGSYTDDYTAIVFNVTVGYNITEARTLEFSYTLYVRDTRAYRVQNGGFEDADDAMAGWSVTGGMGAVSSADTYWEGIKFGKDGEKFFMGNENKGEGYRGELVSPEFTVGGCGFVTFRLGAAGHFTHQYVEVLNSAGNRVLARFYNVLYADRGGFGDEPDKNNPSKVSGQTLMKYKADLSAYIGETVKLRIVDNWEVGGLGFVIFDDLVTYYENESDIVSDYTLAENYVYAVYNGGFETGNLDGWYKTGNIGDISSGTGYWGTAVGSEILYQKEGTFFFEGREGKVSEGDGEWRTGTLTSTVFTVGGSGYMTFLMGAAKTASEQYAEIVDSADGTVLARYTNKLFADQGGFGDEPDKDNPYKVSALTLMKYKADLRAYLGKTVFVRVVDSHVGGDFGMVHVDNFVTYYADAESIGAEYAAAENVLTA